MLTFPARYVQMDNFLTEEEHRQLLEFVRVHNDELVPSEVLPSGGGSKRDTTFRQSRVFFQIEPIWPAFRARLEALLPHLRKEVGVERFALGEIEHQLTASGEGDFFKTHTDSGGSEVETRLLTFVYYFNVEPRGFSGGELRLFDGVIRDDGYLDRAATFTDLEPRDNSIVFFPACLYHEVRPVIGGGGTIEGCRFTINGWYRREAAQPRLAPPSTDPADEEARLRAADELTSLQHRLLPAFTEMGLEVINTPADVQELLLNEMYQHWDEAVAEHTDSTYFQSGDPTIIPLGQLGQEILKRLQPLHEEWSGVKLTPIAAYGMRVYGPGQTLRLHCDRVETHVISSSLNIASDLDGPWPLAIQDHEGASHELPLNPGQMVLYESAKCPHGRTLPLAGRSYCTLFLHYKPTTGWDYTVEGLRALDEATS
jgi:Rps23 Pro-64 3,4-dihydroxylase Tpa1-like proline 4-hydroxylase